MLWKQRSNTIEMRMNVCAKIVKDSEANAGGVQVNFSHKALDLKTSHIKLSNFQRTLFHPKYDSRNQGQ